MTNNKNNKKKESKKNKFEQNKIFIHPEMRGVFTRKAKRSNKTVQKFATYVIKRYKGKTKNAKQLKLLRQAVFAKTAKKWKKRKKNKTRKRKKHYKRI
jgi:glutamate synthase domain-containing protein 1